MGTTTVLTRAYKDLASAKGMRNRLYRAGFPAHTLSVFSSEDGTGEMLLSKMERGLVPHDAAKAYAAHIENGASVVVVRATYKPLNAVRIATAAFESSGALNSGLASERFKVKTPPDHAPHILKDHPRFFTLMPEDQMPMTPVSALFGWPTLAKPNARDSVQRPPKRYFGEGILRRERKRSTSRSEHLSKLFWPMPLLSTRKRGLSVIPGGGQPFSRLFGWSTKT